MVKIKTRSENEIVDISFLTSLSAFVNLINLTINLRYIFITFLFRILKCFIIYTQGLILL